MQQGMLICMSLQLLSYESPNLTVMQVMIAGRFHPDDASAIKWQCQINRCVPNIRQYCQPSSVALTLPVTVISSISTV